MARKKKKSIPKLVTPVSQIAQTVTTKAITAPQDTSLEGVKEIVGRSIEVYNKNLMENKIEISSVGDLEKLVKLQLLLEGKADSRVGKPLGEVEEVTTTELGVPVLDTDDEDVKKVFEKLYEQMNEKNA